MDHVNFRKIYNRHSVEINIVDHCNLTCNNCNHASPQVKERYSDPEEIYSQLMRLKGAYQARQIKLIGGEPLLHPELLEIIKAVRKSHIAERILLVTNGLLLPRMDHKIWRLIDELEISVYPKPGLSRKRYEEYKCLADKFDTELNVLYYPTFHVEFCSVGNDDSELVQRIYNTCKKAHLWHCNSMHRGYFYRCPQSVYIPQLLDLDGSVFETDRVAITDDTEETCQAIKKFIASKQPLHACRYCLGDVGIEQPHELNPAAENILWNSVSVDRLVDYQYLESSEKDITVPQKCRTSYESILDSVVVPMS